MDRRSFLLGTASLTVSQLLIGCGGNNQAKLRIQLLKGSIPGQVVGEFHKSVQQEVQLKFSPVGQLQDLFKQLQAWQDSQKPKDNKGLNISIPFVTPQQIPVADLVTLGDYWLQGAIEKKLIQPLEETKLKKLQHWSTLPKRWQELVRRNDQGRVDERGKVWAAPYRWGNTVIIYRRDKFQQLGWAPKDWGDLWRRELRERISLVDQPREVIGLVLKKLGKSYNTENIDKISELKKELQALNQQVKFYSSNKYIEPLIMGDTWLAVGWSSDVVPVLGRYPQQLAAVVPQSGTSLWTDLWVRPADGKSDILSEWIDFCWRPDIAKQISLITKTNSPIATNIAKSDIPEPLQNLLLNNPEIFDKSEFLLPLSQDSAKQYDSLFNEVKG
jgi:putative spermidine/putrescine transport system substrate-binding protein